MATKSMTAEEAAEQLLELEKPYRELYALVGRDTVLAWGAVGAKRLYRQGRNIDGITWWMLDGHDNGIYQGIYRAMYPRLYACDKTEFDLPDVDELIGLMQVMNGVPYD